MEDLNETKKPDTTTRAGAKSKLKEQTSTSKTRPVATSNGKTTRSSSPARSSKKKERVSETKPRIRIAAQKERALNLLKLSRGNVSVVCEKIGISRTQFYQWISDDPDFKEGVSAIDERNLDFVESRLMRGIKNGDPKLIMFYLNNKGRKRGYGLKNESDGDKNGSITLRISADEAGY